MTTRPTSAITLNKATRRRYTTAFDTSQATLYHQRRPGYHPEILDFLTKQPPGLAIEVGAGTGLFTTHLIAAGWQVIAIDPAAHMLSLLKQSHPEADTVETTIEELDTTPWKHQADLVITAQAWHWIDTVIGSQKIQELLSPTGTFGIVDHHIDTTEDWVLRLCKIMHSGDVHPSQLAPEISPNFAPPEGSWWHWEQSLTVEQVHELMMTRAFYLRTNDRQRQRMHDNLQWYLIDHLGHTPDSTVELPYITAAWRTHPLAKKSH